MAFLKKEKVADFFLDEAHPYSKKRSIKGVHVITVFGVLVLLVLGVGSYLDAKANAERAQEQARKDAERNSKVAAQVAIESNANKGFLETLSSPLSNGTVKQREYSASQLIKRGNSVSDVLPMGTLIRVRLLGKVESADSNSPVSVVVIQSATSPAGYEVIPVGTKVIGQGQLDAARERLQVRFHTFVLPEGDQFTVSAQAAMPDGSSGIAGDFSSGSFKRHASQFLGNFIGGMADGMKDRATGGGMGIPFEPGSLKNGALNGVAQSSLDYAKTSSDEVGKAQATISIPQGEEFNLYLEREFHQ
jgi:type IV secretory pathway VirB10-like protein